MKTKRRVSTQKPDITWSHRGGEKLVGEDVWCVQTGRFLLIRPRVSAPLSLVVRVLNNVYWRRLRCDCVCVPDRRTQLSGFYTCVFGMFLCRAGGADPLLCSSEIWSPFLFFKVHLEEMVPRGQPELSYSHTLGGWRFILSNLCFARPRTVLWAKFRHFSLTSSPVSFTCTRRHHFLKLLSEIIVIK